MTVFQTIAKRLGAATLAAALAVLGAAAQAAPNSITVALPGDFPGLDPSKDNTGRTKG